MLSELHSAFVQKASRGGFFKDPGPMSIDTDLLLSPGYVLSTRVSPCGTAIEEHLEALAHHQLVNDCSAVSVGTLTAPRVETHVGVRIAATIVEPETALAPAEYIAAAFPVLRLVAGIGEPESVAIAFGAPSIRRDVLYDSLATLNRNGRVVAAGEGASMRQSPYTGIVTAARLLMASERGLRRGQLVVTGSVHESVAVQPGDHIRADVLGLGSVCMCCVQ
jgi:2-keto-4-pentenoate hydratase